MNRVHLIVLIAAFGALAALTACESETGPDAPPRQNGCIDTDCATSSSSSGGTDAGSDAK